MVATGSKDCKIIFWKLKTGKKEIVLKGHENEITEIRFAFEGDRLISGSVDKTARIWDVKTGMCLHILTNSTTITNPHFDFTGEFCLATEEKVCKVWDVVTGKQLFAFSEA